MQQLDSKSAQFQVVSAPTGQLEVIRIIGDVEPVFDSLVYLAGEQHTITVTLRNGTSVQQSVTISGQIWGQVLIGSPYLTLPAKAVTIGAGQQQNVNIPFTIPEQTRARKGWLRLNIGQTEYKWETDIWLALTRNWGLDVADYIHPESRWGWDALGMPYSLISYNQAEQTKGPPVEEAVSNPQVLGVFWAGHGGPTAVYTTKSGRITIQQVEQWMANRPPMLLTFGARWTVGCTDEWYTVFSKQPIARSAYVVPRTVWVGSCEPLDGGGHAGLNAIVKMKDILRQNPTMTFYSAWVLAVKYADANRPGRAYANFRGDQTIGLAALGL